VPKNVEIEQAHSVGGILRESASRDGNAIAILAPGRPPLTHGALFEQAERIGGRLRSLGIAAQHRVAVALPHGPEMATGFLSIAAVAGCAPLNPKYHAIEFEFYLKDLHASALVIGQEGNPEAEAAAKNLGIPILPAVRGECAGAFDLNWAGRNDTTGDSDWASDRDTAAVAHLRYHGSPETGPVDGSEPSGLPVKAGGSVVCTDGVYGVDFFRWMQEFRPRYTAVPTMHLALDYRSVES
jgi:acyl-CoA synthetase (AMP-forming)/AMP-acid ligase II